MRSFREGVWIEKRRALKTDPWGTLVLKVWEDEEESTKGLDQRKSKQ